MKGLTGGQYSVLRFVVGMVLIVLLMHGLFHAEAAYPWDRGAYVTNQDWAEARDSEFRVWPLSTWGIRFQFGLALCLAVFFALGQSVATATVLLLVWSLLSMFPRHMDTGYLRHFTIIALVLHVGLPSGPYGSLAGRQRPDPGGGWRMTTGWLRKTWGLLALSYFGYGVILALDGGWVDGSALLRILQRPQAQGGDLAELALALPSGLWRALTWIVLAGFFLFAPLICSTKTRPWIWLWIALVHLGSMVTFDLPIFWATSVALLFAHALVFDPEWIKARSAKGVGNEVLYYDGECGLCHGAVRFVLAEDLAGRFHLAPLQSEAFLRATANFDRSALPDSVLIQTGDGAWLSKGRAVRYLLGRLGGPWRMLGGLLGLVPGWLLDFGYDGIAKVRRRIFRKPANLCPLVPPELGRRFLT